MNFGSGLPADHALRELCVAPAGRSSTTCKKVNLTTRRWPSGRERRAHPGCADELWDSECSAEEPVLADPCVNSSWPEVRWLQLLLLLTSAKRSVSASPGMWMIELVGFSPGRRHAGNARIAARIASTSVAQATTCQGFSSMWASSISATPTCGMSTLAPFAHA